MNEELIESIEGNYYVKQRGIPKGCQQCLKGAKAVLFLNGICQNPPQCSWYCPLSEKRKNKPISYIDEIKISKKQDIFTEISKINAQGMSITGGEPLLPTNLQKTLNYIKLVKNKMGKRFHIHLYTNGVNFNKNIANKLSKAGLDEIRFHPPKNKWKNIKFALNKGMSVGAEVPLIPDEYHIKNLKQFILYLNDIDADFINLNEFEYCEPNSKYLRERGYKLKEGTISSVKYSKKKAPSLMEEFIPITSLKIHFCSIRAKDYYQLKNRYLRRAPNIKKPYEEVSEEGLLIYGQIKGKQEDLIKLRNYLLNKSGMPEKLISFKRNSIQLPYYVLIDDEFLESLKSFDLKGYIVESLPFNEYGEKEHRQITEITPIEIFKEEIDYIDKN
jgi:hypothetical protein